MSWALEQQEVRNPTLRFLLVCVANYASTAGRNSFPSVASLEEDSGLSESTIRRGLDKLEELGMLVRGNQSAAAAEIPRADRRPVVYDIPILRGVTVKPREPNGVSTEASRGVKTDSTGCQALTPNPKRSEENLKRESGGALNGAPPPEGTLREKLAAREKPPEGRAKNFEEEFLRRFGVKPS